VLGQINVQTLTESILRAGLSEQVLDETSVANLVGGSDSRRYGLVNRACRAGELHRLRRGLYVLDGRFRKQAAHPFMLAQTLQPGSYISLATALVYYGWMARTGMETASITPGRKTKHYSHAVFGEFDFYPLALANDCLLELIIREQAGGQTMLIARPARALMDLVCLRKYAWQGLDWLVAELHIDPGKLQLVGVAEFKILKHVYKQRRVKIFLDNLVQELSGD
jgi:hypothetical protein